MPKWTEEKMMEFSDMKGKQDELKEIVIHIGFA